MDNNKNKEYDHYRELYLKNLSNEQFPWEPAYYYYMQNISRIDVLTFEDFKEDLLSQNYKYKTEEERFENVTLPIYENLDKYFCPNVLMDKNDNVIMLC